MVPKSIEEKLAETERQLKEIEYDLIYEFSIGLRDDYAAKLLVERDDLRRFIADHSFLLED